MKKLGLVGLVLITALGCHHTTIIKGEYEGYPVRVRQDGTFFTVSICQYDDNNKPKESLWYNCISGQSSDDGRIYQIIRDFGVTKGHPLEKYFGLNQLMDIYNLVKIQNIKP